MDKLNFIREGFYDVVENPDGSFDATKDTIRFHKIRPISSQKDMQKYIIDYGVAL